MEDVNKSIEEIRKTEDIDLESGNLAVGQSVVLDCVEDATYKLSNGHARVSLLRLRRGSLARSQDDTRRNFRER